LLLPFWFAVEEMKLVQLFCTEGNNLGFKLSYRHL